MFREADEEHQKKSPGKKVKTEDDLAKYRSCGLWFVTGSKS